MMRTLGNIVLVAFLVGFVITVEGAGHWGYPDLENNEEFPEWDGLCNHGKYQSPIDLQTKEAIKGVYEDFDFDDYDQPLKNPKIINTGHSAQIVFDEPAPTVSGGGLKGEYELEQIHFHWFSEHTIDRRRYILEAHLVHFNQEYSNISEAVKHKDGIAVLGVLFHDSTDENDMLDPIVDNLGKISPPDPADTSVEIEDIIPSSLLPSNPSKDYFRYQGSLTTPTCDESVIWTVYLRSKPISQDQVHKFTQLEIGDGKKLKNNYRNTKQASGRALILVSDWDWIDDDDDDDDDAGSSAFSMHLLSASYLPARLFSLFLLLKASSLYLL